MDEFSLESLSEQIYHYKTKEYFDEVINSYNNKSYRSATVMLWSISVIDLIFKLNDLFDLYSDTTAESILNSVNAEQQRDRKSSKWEHKLIKDISDRTKLLDSESISFLDYLFQQRNLSAHPVLNSNLELYRPNRITVRSLIVNSINNILSKPPFFSKDILESFVIDIAASKNSLREDEEKIKHYLESRFLSKMTEKVRLEIFKGMWKFVFRIESPEAIENRNINFQVLHYLYNKEKNKSEDLINNEVDYFSNISKEQDTISSLIKFLSKNNNVYKCLNESAKILINDRIENNESDFYQSSFLYGNLQEFYESIVKYLDSEEGLLSIENIEILSELSDSPEWNKKVISIKNYYYGKSFSFDIAESRFSMFVSPYLDSYDKEDILDLIKYINNNDQIYGRYYNKYVNTRVKSECDKILGEDFDYSEYENFISATL